MSGSCPLKRNCHRNASKNKFGSPKSGNEVLICHNEAKEEKLGRVCSSQYGAHRSEWASFVSEGFHLCECHIVFLIVCGCHFMWSFKMSQPFNSYTLSPDINNKYFFRELSVELFPFQFMTRSILCCTVVFHRGEWRTHCCWSRWAASRDLFEGLGGGPCLHPTQG